MASTKRKTAPGRKTIRQTQQRRRAMSANALVNRYQCDSCGWIYDPAELGGIDLDDQPEGWTCDQCQADTDHFQILVPRDDDSVTDEDAAAGLSKTISSRRLAHIKSSPTPVETLRKQKERGRLNLQPDFQRYEVWNAKLKSQLVESIIADLPIPTIYLAEEPDGTRIVVDGQQRLNAIFEYMSDQYGLTGLTIFDGKLDGVRFSKLPERVQEKIEERSLDVTVIHKETDKDVRFDLFERLNRGSVKLNDQELRNCTYRGPYNDWLKQSALNADLRAILNLKQKEGGKPVPHKRMVDVELVLRFMAFQDQTYLNFPDKKTNKFLNDQMEKHKTGLTPVAAKKASQRFCDAIGAARTIFGKRAFKRFAPGDVDSPNGTWESRTNRALMDTVLYWFTRYDKGTLIKHADVIYEATLDLMSDPEFADLIMHTISEKRRVEGRFKLYEVALEKVLGPSGKGVRAFKKSFKESLWERGNEKCSICRNQIGELDDAHVDHIEAWGRGGKTETKNAGLSHRFCNQSKGVGGLRWIHGTSKS